MSNDKVIEELRAKRKADLEDLIDQIVEFNPSEHFSFNVEGAYLGEYTPIYMYEE